MRGYPVDHVGLAVSSIEKARPLFERLTGAQGTPLVEVPSHDINIAFFGSLELLEPRTPESHLAEFLASRGGQLHHVAYRVSDIVQAMGELEADGFESLDPEPRMGAGGRRIAFLHPAGTAGLFIELVEGASGDV